MSLRKFLNHSASLAALSHAIDSGSKLDMDIHVCLDDFHDIAAPPNAKTYPLVNVISVLSEI